jgi:hypothetical protein
LAGSAFEAMEIHRSILDRFDAESISMVPVTSQERRV